MKKTFLTFLAIFGAISMIFSQNNSTYLIGHGTVYRNLLNKTQAEILQWKTDCLKDEMGYIDFSAQSIENTESDFEKQAELIAQNSFKNNPVLGKNTKIIKRAAFLIFNPKSEQSKIFFDSSESNFFESYQQEKMLHQFSQILKEENLFQALSNFLEKIKTQYQGGSKAMFDTDDYNIPSYLIPEKWIHWNDKTDDAFPENPGFFANSGLHHFYENANPESLDFIYTDVVSNINQYNKEIGVSHFVYKTLDDAKIEAKKMKDDGTGRVFYLIKSKTITTVFSDDKKDKNLVKKLADYFTEINEMERFYPEKEEIPTTIAESAVSSQKEENSSDYQSAVAEAVDATEAILDSTFVKPVFLFEKYKCNVTANKIRKKINWNTLPEAKKQAKEIQKIFNTTEPNFANFYVIATTEKDPEITLGFMIDLRNGSIYKLPELCFLPEENVDFRKNSRLFVANECSTIVDLNSSPYKGYEWNEDTKKFILLKTKKYQ